MLTDYVRRSSGLCVLLLDVTAGHVMSRDLTNRFTCFMQGRQGGKQKGKKQSVNKVMM